MVMGNCILKMKTFFKVYLQKEDVKEKDVILGMMVAIMKVILKIMWQMDTEFLLIEQVTNMKVNGRIICQMAQDK